MRANKGVYVATVEGMTLLLSFGIGENQFAN